MNHKQFFSSIGRLIIGGALCSAFSVSAQSTLSLNVGQATYTIKKEMYGGLLENWGRDIYTGLYVGTASTIPNVNGMRRDIITAFKECGVSILDWPGGCFAEQYNWTNGSNPNKSARPGGDCASGTASNGFATEDYFQLCDSLNSIPYITANTTNLSAAGMTAWLNHIDSVFPNRVKYWKMGNEPWGGCATGISITSYINRYNTYKAAIPSRFLSQFARIADGGTADYLYKVSWIDSLMKCEMGSMEGVTIHYYGAFSGASIGFTVDSFYVRIQVSMGLFPKLAIYDSIMLRYDPNYTVGLMVDEWGAWYSNAPGKDFPQSSVRDAIIASLNMNMFNNRCRRIKMGCVAQPVNTIQSLILAENPLQPRIVRTPTFYVYKMYKVHQQATMVPVTLTTPNIATYPAIPTISASASVDGTGKLHISMCNTNATSTHTVAITLNNAPVYTSCTGTVINGPSYNSYNDFGVAENVNIQNFTGATLAGNTVNLTMPVHSVVTLELTPAVGVIKQSLNAIKPSFVIGTAAGGTIVLRSTVAARTPFTLGLYTVDGRSVVETCKGTLEPGRKTFVWRPKNLGMGTNVYIVKMKSGESTLSQRALFDKR
jgi:alpha-L-arabinofuranosidase